jgi:hypothetical protein
MGRGKGKIHPRTGLEDPEGEYMCKLYSLFNLGNGWKWEVNATPWPLYHLERTGTNCIRGWLDPRGLKISPSTGIRSPDSPARRKSLYWLSYRGPLGHSLKYKPQKGWECTEMRASREEHLKYVCRQTAKPSRMTRILEWSVCTCLTQLYLMAEVYLHYYLRYNYLI